MTPDTPIERLPLGRLAALVRQPVLLLVGPTELPRVAYANPAARDALFLPPAASLQSLLAPPARALLTDALGRASSEGCALGIDLSYVQAGVYSHDIYHLRRGYLVLARALDPVFDRMQRLISTLYQEAWQQTRASFLPETRSLAEDATDVVLEHLDSLHPQLFRSKGLVTALIGGDGADVVRLPVALRACIRGSDLLLPYRSGYLIVAAGTEGAEQSLQQRVALVLSGFGSVAVYTEFISPPSRRRLLGAVRRLTRMAYGRGNKETPSL